MFVTAGQDIFMLLKGYMFWVMFMTLHL